MGLKDKARNNAYMKEYRIKNPEICKNIVLRKQFNITLECYYALLKSQDNRCKICNKIEDSLDHRTKKPRFLAVDHCHTTGKIRGLLCTRCNRGLGQFQDDKILLQKAIDYLDSN